MDVARGTLDTIAAVDLLHQREAVGALLEVSVIEHCFQVRLLLHNSSRAALVHVARELLVRLHEPRPDVPKVHRSEHALAPRKRARDPNLLLLHKLDVQPGFDT